MARKNKKGSDKNANRPPVQLTIPNRRPQARRLTSQSGASSSQLQSRFTTRDSNEADGTTATGSGSGSRQSTRNVGGQQSTIGSLPAGLGGRGRRGSDDDDNDGRDYRASFTVRSSGASIGMMSTTHSLGGRSTGVMTVDMNDASSTVGGSGQSDAGSGADFNSGQAREMEVEMRSINLPPSGDDGDNDTLDDDSIERRLNSTIAFLESGGGLENTLASFSRRDTDDRDEEQKQQEEEERQEVAQQQRRRVRSRQRDRQDFRTSCVAKDPALAQIVSSTDEDPNFWGVSNRWFSDAGEFVGELTGMATRRASIDENVAAELMPRTRGREIVSAADDDDDEDEENSRPFSQFSDHDDNHTPLFDELSSLGDTPTHNYSVMTRKSMMKGAWLISLSFMLIWIAAQVALRSSSWFQGLRSGRTHGSGIAMFSPSRSRRYAKMRAHLVQISGSDVFLDEGSPQHRALVYLADGDSLGLDPHDPTVSAQLLQRYALAVFYFATNGPNWKSRTYWLTGRHECGWLFVICSDIKKGSTTMKGGTTDRDIDNVDDDYSNFLDSELGLGEGKIVTGLSLYGQGLRGTIPKEIQTLEYLHVLDLGNNFLDGIIGTEFGRLQHLHKLYLENNRLKGGVEAVVWLSSLKRVNLENNHLMGTIPYDLGKLKHLEEIRMGQNTLDGSIPSSLFRSKTLTKLDLHDNEFTSEFSIHPASTLKYLYLYNNKLSGEILRGSLCSVSDTLIDLRLNNNSFVGKIPDLNCTMEKMELLSLAENELVGPIHDSLGERIPRLREIHLYENNLLSTIPKSIFRPENLTAVLLGNNELTGTLTADMVSDAHYLAHFYVNSNKMTGRLDNFAKARNLDSLRKLRLEYNNFSGSIPKMNMIENLELLYLYNNSLSGTLDNLGSSVKLRKLKLSNNSLEGEITPQLGELKRLEVLSLNGNKLEGTLPTELRQLTALKELHIDNNDISGAVPQEVCDLRKSVLEHLVSDCGGKHPKVSCSCCTECV